MRRFVFLLLVFSAPACGVDVPATPVPEDVRQEEQLLAERKSERARDLERQLPEAAGEQRMSVLLQLADLSSARAIEIIDRNIDAIGDRPTLLNAAVSKGGVDARALLTRAVDSWGADAGHPIERLHYAFGPEIAPDLRARLAKNPPDGVRRAIHMELIRLKEPRALAELRREIAAASPRTSEDAEQAIEALSRASESVELAADVGRLFRRVNETHLHLKQHAAGIALWLGDQESAEHVIDLLASPGSSSFNYPGLYSLEELLKRHTKEAFARPEEWKAWWTSTGRRTPLFTAHVPAGDESGIVNAVIAWGKTTGSFARDAIVYLQDDSKYSSGRQQIRAGLDTGIRMYTATEISLLRKTPFSVSDIETNGEKAFATLGDGSNTSNWRLKRLELSRQKGEWRVTFASSSSAR
jgi:hypothetical protein